MRRMILPTLLVGLLGVPSIAAENATENLPVFSGPQVGEVLAPFKINRVFDEHAGQSFDFVTANQGKPQLLVFVHELTRPSIGLVRAVMKYAATREQDGLARALVFLSDDATGMEERLNRARHALPGETTIGISADGQEGPGSYGLNRNMTLTVLVANQGKVTANFAIVQPTPAVDAPKIVAAITKVIGGEVPDLAELGIERYQAGSRPRTQAPRGSGNAQDLPPELQGKLRQLIRRTNSAEDVKRIAAEIEEATKDDPKSRAIIGTIAGRVQNAKYFPNLVPEAQEIIRGWAKRLGADGVASEEPTSNDEANND